MNTLKQRVEKLEKKWASRKWLFKWVLAKEGENIECDEENTYLVVIRTYENT